MHYKTDTLYHIYNRGVNRRKVFTSHREYLCFIDKMETHLHRHCKIIAWVLMPNHFHWLVEPNRAGVKRFELGMGMSKLSRSIGTTLSSYTQAFNLRHGRVGNLFVQNTKWKQITRADRPRWPEVCFKYIHRNPVAAGLCEAPEEWPYGSAQEYIFNEGYDLCDQKLAQRLVYSGSFQPIEII